MIVKATSTILLVIGIFFSSCNKQDSKEKADTVLIDIDTTALSAAGSTDSFDVQNFQNLVETYEDPERSEWQNPELVVQKLGDLQDKVVADIGAGTGYFTFRMAEKGAQIIAIDIDERFLSYIEERKTELQHIIPEDRVETRLSLENDPLLKKGEVDAALLVNTYHFLGNRVEYLKKIKNGLKQGGKLIIVDYKAGQMPVGPPEEVKISPDEATDELLQAGFENIDVDESGLQFQYIISAQKK